MASNKDDWEDIPLTKAEKEQDDWEDLPVDSDTVSEDEISQMESAGLGAVQGATLGFGDEIGAALTAPIATAAEYLDDSPESVEQQLIDQGFTGDLEGHQGLLKKYQELRDTTRESNKEAQETNPMTYMGAEIAGGIAPALASGGASATAGAMKTAASTGLKELAKTGAKYGAASGLGYSEAEDLGGMATDTAKGAALGATVGVALPTALKGAASAAKTVGKGAKGLAQLMPGSEDITAAFKYGLKGRKINVQDIDEDLMTLADKLYNKIKSAKNEIDIKGVKEELNILGIKVNTMDDINLAVKELESISKGDIFDGKSSKVLDGLKKLRGDDVQSEALAQNLEKKALKKTLEGASKEEQAIIKAEKKLGKKALDSADELETVSNVNKQMDDLEIPFDTSEGQFGGARGKFKSRKIDPETGEEIIENYSKEITSDTTPFQPTKVQTGIDPATGLPYAVQKDLGTGKITAQIGKLTDKVETDLSNMTVSEVDDVITQINSLTKVAQNEGYTADPAIKRAIRLAGELRKSVNKAVSESGAGDELMVRRAKMSDIMSAEDLLNINSPKSLRPDINQRLQKTEIGEKLGFEKGFKSREESRIAEELLEPQLKGGLGAEFQEMRNVNKLLGRESANETITKSSLYSQLIGKVPNVAGRGVRAVTESKPYQMSKNLVKLPKEKLQELVGLVEQSENQAIKNYLNPLTNAMNAESDATKGALLWSMGQQPAFREAVRQLLPEDVDIISEAGAAEMPNEYGASVASEETEETVSRDPASTESDRESLKDVRGIRNNNPGNIEYNESNKWQGETGVEEKGRFTTFDSPEMGIRALTKLLINKASGKASSTGGKKLETVRELIASHAPDFENDVDAYVDAIGGLDPDSPLDVNDTDTMFKLIKGIIKHENGGVPYDDATIMEGMKKGNPNFTSVERGPASEESVMEQSVEPEQEQPQANPYQALLDEFNNVSKTVDMSGLDQGEVEHVESQIRANRDLEDVEMNVPKGERIDNTRKIFPELDRLHKMVASGGMNNEVIMDDIVGLIEKSFYSPEDSRDYINKVMSADTSQEITALMREMEQKHLQNILNEYQN